MQAAEYLAEAPLWQADQQALILIDRIEQTADATSFIFNTATPVRFDFKPGQFTLLEIEIEGVLHHRAYTISSSPSRPDTLEITIKRVDDGLISNHLINHLKPGDQLNASMPTGIFNLIDGSQSDHYALISAGSGVTPMMSMCRWLLDNRSTAQIHFIHSARNEDDVIFYDELISMAALHSNFHLDLLLTRQTTETRHHCGRLTDDKLKQLLPDLNDLALYTCGSNSFMDNLEQMLGKHHFDMDRFHKESFDGVVLPPTMHSNAELAYEISVPSFGKSTMINSDERLMDALQREQVPIIVACQSGICGSCKCRVITGEVESTSQAPLTPEEIAQGYVLACSSRAKSNLEIALS